MMTLRPMLATSIVFSLAGTLAPGAAVAADRSPNGWPDQDPLGPRPSVQVGDARLPAANPYVGLLPDASQVDWRYWQRYATRGSARVAAESGRALPEPLDYDEQEPALQLGDNDSPRTAEAIGGFGTGAGEEAGVSVRGNLATGSVRITRIKRTREDDGAIPLARTTRIGLGRDGIRTSGRIGDEPHGEQGSGSGDFDYYRVKLGSDEQVVATAEARAGSDLEPLIAIWSKTGRLQDYQFPRGNSVQLTTPLTAGTYYVMMGGCCTYPRSRFKSGSGDGAGSEGRYRFSVQASRPDSDFFAVSLEAGDVLGGTVDGATSLSVYDPDRQKVFGSRFDASFIYPDSTPMPGGGRAVVDHVASTTGRHTVEVVYGIGGYRADLEVYRAGLDDDSAGTEQTLFLDFDGERLNTGIFGGSGVTRLSPMRAFLDRWGIAAAREDAVIDAVIANVRENVRRDLARRGLNGSFDVEILNSRDDADPWGEDNVSRVIVGGSIRESGVFTIGIAESIDPGNFDQEESALLLLDLLSARERQPYSINHFLSPRSDRVAFVGQVLGNVVAHEAGHYLGNWHVDQFDASPNLMDQGGNYRALFGPGPDGVGGTADDRDVDFGPNRLNPFEGFEGLENTLQRAAFGLTAGG